MNHQQEHTRGVSLKVRSIEQRLDRESRIEPSLSPVSVTMSNLISMLQMFPGVRGIWPAGPTDGSWGNLIDQSGAGNHLGGVGSHVMEMNGLVPVRVLDQKDNQYWAAADGPVYDITGLESYIHSSLRGLTILGWFKPSLTSTVQTIVGKLTGATQKSYRIFQLNTDAIRFAVSEDGAVEVLITTVVSATIDEWSFICARFTPKTEMSVWLNDSKATRVSGVPEFIFDSSSTFNVGSNSTPLAFFTGSVGLVGLFAAAVPDTLINRFYQLSRSLYPN